MGNHSVSHRKTYDAVRSAKDVILDIKKSGSDSDLPRLQPAKRARSRSLKANHGESSNRAVNGDNGSKNNKFHGAKKAHLWKRPEYRYPAMIPEPDYSDSEEENHQTSIQESNSPIRLLPKQLSPRSNSKGFDTSNMTTTVTGNNGAIQLTDDGLVIPKKLANPCLESQERQKLHKELMFNQKIGKSVLGQKTELQKAMEKFRDDQKKKEFEEEKVNKRSSFEKRLHEQATKIKNIEEELKKEDVNEDQPEFLRVHARVRAHTFPVDTES